MEYKISPFGRNDKITIFYNAINVELLMVP
jgi:hypothetical protein